MCLYVYLIYLYLRHAVEVLSKLQIQNIILYKNDYYIGLFIFTSYSYTPFSTVIFIMLQRVGLSLEFFFKIKVRREM